MQAVGWTKISAGAQSRHHGFATFSAIVKRTTAARVAGPVSQVLEARYSPGRSIGAGRPDDRCVHVGAAAPPVTACFCCFYLHPDRHHRNSTNRFAPTKNRIIIDGCGRRPMVWPPSRSCLRLAAQRDFVEYQSSTTGDLSGNKLSQAPGWTVSSAVDYRLPFERPEVFPRASNTIIEVVYFSQTRTTRTWRSPVSGGYRSS